MKKNLHILIIIVFSSWSAWGQNNNAQENIIIHHNSSHHLVGETLYYSLFCTNKKTGHLSPLSKYVYFQIIGEDGIVYQKKHKLSFGVANGSFFIPSKLKTGKYYLVAHTLWMKNFDNYSSTPITLINPYLNYSKPSISPVTSIDFSPLAQQVNVNRTDLVFETRQHSALTHYLEEGVYSISIRKASSIEKISPFTNNSKPYEEHDREGQHGFLKNRLLNKPPEFQSELMFGKVTLKNGSPAIKKPVILALASSTFNISSAKTNEQGQFIIEYQSQEDQSINAFVTVYDFLNEYTVNIEDNFITNLDDLKFEDVKLDSSFIQEIIDRSIQSQIENEFYLPDSSLTYHNNTIPILEEGDYSSSYLLDDYTRFKTLEEHFIEYISGARIRKNNSHVFWVNTPYLELNFSHPPLILLDGIPVNGRAILEFNPYRIKKVDLVNTRLFLQNNFFDGVVSLSSLDGDLGGFKELLNTKQLSLKGTIENQLWWKNQKLKEPNIPDQRIQLLWQSPYTVNQSGKQNISFLTSDITGKYHLIIKGVTSNGTPISEVKSFEVKQ